MEISANLDKAIDAIIAEYPVRKSAAMMIMHRIQEDFGFFDDAAVEYVAKKLEVRPIEIYGMLSFYPMFSDSPRGRIHIKVCRTLSCALAGSINLAQEISRLVDCPINETRGLYTLEFVECLGNCTRGANVQVNDKLFDNVKAENAEAFVDMLKKADAQGSLEAKPSGAIAQGENFESPAYKG